MTCSHCGTIPAESTANTGRDEYFQAPITTLRFLDIDRDDDLRECPLCGAMFLWHDDRAFTGSGASDSETLIRFSDERAAVVRAFVHRGDRAFEEVASLADQWLALPEAAPDLVSRWVLKRDRELARALVPRMLDALGRGAVPGRFVEAYASGHDAAFVKTELERRPSTAVFDTLRVLCRRLLCSICRAVLNPATLTPYGASPDHDAADCPECGSMFVLEGERGWSRLVDYESDALRACLRRDGIVPVGARETVNR